MKSYCTYDGEKEYILNLPSRNKISKETGISLPTIRKYDMYMRELGYLENDSFIQSTELIENEKIIKNFLTNLDFSAKMNDRKVINTLVKNILDNQEEILNRDNYFVTMSREDLRTLGCLAKIKDIDKDWAPYIILYCRNWLNMRKGQTVSIYPSKICESAGVDLHSSVKVKNCIEDLIDRKVFDGELVQRNGGRGNVLLLKGIDMTPLKHEMNLQ